MCLLYKIPVKRFNSYLEKFNNKDKSSCRAWILWKDYINAAENLKYDLKNEVVVFPKNLKQKHDIATRLQENIINQEKVKKMQKLQAKREAIYQYDDGEYVIVLPQSMQDIIDEGKVLQHCVGGYADRHAEGKTTILFMRSCSDPSKPLYTIEMTTNDEVRQAYGFKNQSKPPKEFIDKWLSEIELRKKPKRSKKQPQAAQKAAV